jgi:hypothetical protein
VSAQDTAHYILIDLDAESQRDLLGNARTAPTGIAPLHGHDGIDAVATNGGTSADSFQIGVSERNAESSAVLRRHFDLPAMLVSLSAAVPVRGELSEGAGD